MTAAVFAFSEDRLAAKRLADALDVGLQPVHLHTLPDGESLPSVRGATQTVLLYRSLERPDAKLMPLFLACDALRRAGARRLVLAGPYLPYLRQDAVFEPGQPLSRDVFGALLGPRFERIVTVEPHLHRTSDLTPVFAGTPVTALSAAGLFAARIGAADGPVIVGPDGESAPWVARIAETLGAPHFVLCKLRRSDREVELQMPPGACVAGRRVVIVDDICSTGGTLIGAVRQLRAAGAASIEIAVVHALFKPGVSATLRRMGVRSVMSTDACPHPSNRIPLAGLLADALFQELSPMTLKLTFHGAAGCVTGFCARLETGQATLLIDCGMFQGPKTLKALNYGDFPFDVRSVDAVLLTHAHIDHSGLLPKLMRAGYHGPIYATAGTRDLCAVMLPDAGDIQESEVRQLNRRNQRRGRREVEPIYTSRDAVRTLDLFRKVKLGDLVEVAPGVTATYWEAGHILGAASIEVKVETEEGPVSLLFSGDLGPGGRDYSPDPAGPTGVDYLILELTYGDRDRPTPDGEARRALLADELNAAHDAGGPLLIPAFAVERSQELLADLLTLMEERRVPDADIFLDSPLAIEATEVFQKRGWNRTTGVNPFVGLRHSGRLKFLRDPGESDQLERLRGWHVIVAASGMCDAGRVRRHLKRLLWQRQATVLLSGYQAVGTLGRILQEGANRVSIQGEDIQVRARIRSLDVYSGHADAGGLVAWGKARGPVAAGVFLAHGEPNALEGLRGRLIPTGLAAERIRIPALDESYVLTRQGVQAELTKGRRLPPDAAARADWHNARSQLLMELNQQLEIAKDDRAREAIIAQLSGALRDGPAAQASRTLLLGA